MKIITETAGGQIIGYTLHGNAVELGLFAGVAKAAIIAPSHAATASLPPEAGGMAMALNVVWDGTQMGEKTDGK